MEKDEIDQAFDIFWETADHDLTRRMSYAFFIAGVKCGLAQCQKIIRGDDDAPADT